MLSVWFVQRRLQTRCGVWVSVLVARSASWSLALGAVCVRAPGLGRGFASGPGFGRGLRPGRVSSHDTPAMSFHAYHNGPPVDMGRMLTMAGDYMDASDVFLWLF